MAHEQANSNIGHNIYQEKTLWLLMCAIAPEPLLRPEKGGSVDCSYHHLVVVIVCLYAGCCCRRILDFWWFECKHLDCTKNCFVGLNFWACLHHPIIHECQQRIIHISTQKQKLKKTSAQFRIPSQWQFCIFQEINSRILWMFSAMEARVGFRIGMSCAKLMHL